MMGGVVAKGQDNDELIDHLVEAKFIRNKEIEQAFRSVDRGDFFPGQFIEDAYKDFAMKCDHLHISAPCIYCEVMENFDLEEGLSFLNIGSGTGYLSTLVGLSLGPFGTNHGIDIFQDVLDFADKKVDEFIRFSDGFNPIKFCPPKFSLCNIECLDMSYRKYDRIYCGARVSKEDMCTDLKKLLNINGILIYPYGESLIKCQQVSPDVWQETSLLHVQFSDLIDELPDDKSLVRISSQPFQLQELCRHAVLKYITKERLDQVDSLPIPKMLIQYLKYYRDPSRPKPVRTIRHRPHPDEEMDIEPF